MVSDIINSVKRAVPVISIPNQKKYGTSGHPERLRARHSLPTRASQESSIVNGSQVVTIEGFFSSIGNFFKKLWKAVIDFVKKVVEWVKEHAKEIIIAIVVILMIYLFITYLPTMKAALIKEGFATTSTSGMGWFFAGASSLLSKGATAVKDGFTYIFESLPGAISTLVPVASDFVKEHGDAIIGGGLAYAALKWLKDNPLLVGGLVVGSIFLMKGNDSDGSQVTIRTEGADGE